MLESGTVSGYRPLTTSFTTSPGVFFHDGLAQIRAAGAGEQAMQQPSQHGAHVAFEDVAHAVVLPGLLDQSSQRPLVLVDRLCRRVFCETWQGALQFAMQLDVFSDFFLELGDGLGVGIDALRGALEVGVRSGRHRNRSWRVGAGHDDRGEDACQAGKPPWTLQSRHRSPEMNAV